MHNPVIPTTILTYHSLNDAKLMLYPCDTDRLDFRQFSVPCERRRCSTPLSTVHSFVVVVPVAVVVATVTPPPLVVSLALMLLLPLLPRPPLLLQCLEYVHGLHGSSNP